jgi:hypothetical protein
MDERQAQIRERAGLEESKLNLEFVDWLRRWATPILTVALVVAAGFAGMRYLKQQRTAKIERAFAEFEAARSGANPSPDALAAIADEFEGVGSVSTLARLDAADVLMNAVRTGLRPGATLNPDGTLANPDDVLPASDRDALLTRAAAMYQRVLDATQGNADQSIIAINALFGLAAVDENKGNVDAARARYTQIKDLATKSGFDSLARLAESRQTTLPTLAIVKPLVASPTPPTPPALPALPAPEPVPGPQDPSAPATPATPAPAPAPAPVPAPAPAPAPAPGPGR